MLIYFPRIGCNSAIAADHPQYPFCASEGLTDDDIRTIEADPARSLLQARENAMPAFVVRAVKDPRAVDPDEIAALRETGWSDQDLVDALSQGVSMIDHAIMMQVFRMDQHCAVPD